MSNVSLTPKTRESRLAGSRLWLWVSLAYVFLRALPNLTYPIARDQAVHFVIGRGLLEGQLLYRDLWCNRPPGIFVLHALFVKIFGSVMWVVGVLDILWLLAISYFIYRFTERYLGRAAAVLAVVLNSSWHIGEGYWQAAQIETFLMLFVFAAYFVVARGGKRWALEHFLGGLFFGCAFWLKYNALAFLPLFVVVPYLDRRGLDDEPRRIGLNISWPEWLKRSAAFGAGLASLVLAGLGYFWLAGTWGALREVQFEVLPRYTAMALERTPYYWLWAAWRTELVLGLLTEMALAGSLVIAWRKRELGKIAPVLIGAATGSLSVALTVRYHAFAFETCYPFFAMAWAYMGVRVYESFRGVARDCAARGWRWARVLLWVVFANILAWPLPDEIPSVVAHYQALGTWWRGSNRERFYALYPWSQPISHFADQLRVISYVRENSSPQDTIFVWGSEALIYYLSERRPAARFVQNLALVSPWSPPAWREELVERLEASRPRFIVVVRGDEVPSITYTDWDSEEFLRVYPDLAIFISDNYGLALNLRYFAVYRRHDSPAAPADPRQFLGESAGGGSPRRERPRQRSAD